MQPFNNIVLEQFKLALELLSLQSTRSKRLPGIYNVLSLSKCINFIL